jgi:succinate-acetate transporter protein
LTTSEVSGASASAQPSSAAPASNISRIADPGPWAVTAFATTSFVLGIYNAGILDKAGSALAIPFAFFFGGLIQIIVAILEVQRGNLFGAAVFGTYGPFWVIYGALNTLNATSIPKENVDSALSLFLAVFAVVSLYLFVASLRTDVILAIIIGLIFLGLVALSIGEGSGLALAGNIGGWITLVFAVLAWYHAASDIIQSTFGRRLLPVFPLS